MFGYLIGILPNERQERRQPLSPEMREACRRLERYSQQVALIVREHFDTEEDVKAFQKATQNKINTLCKERRKHYDKITRTNDPEEKQRNRDYASYYTEQITALRNDLRAAGNILKDTERIKDTVRAELAFDDLQMELESPTKNRGRTR